RGVITRQSDLLQRHGALTMVFQEDTLAPWLTVERNAMLDLQFLSYRERKRVKLERREQARELLDMVGLTPFHKAYPYQLSGGMKRRLAFISAVAPRPAAVLLDEPFASVDEPTRVQIHQDVLSIIRKQQMTVVLVTHDLAEAATLCDTVLVMSRR